MSMRPGGFWDRLQVPAPIPEYGPPRPRLPLVKGETSAEGSGSKRDQRIGPLPGAEKKWTHDAASQEHSVRGVKRKFTVFGFRFRFTIGSHRARFFSTSRAVACRLLFLTVTSMY